MKLIIGLGNPSKEYENTRHNVGFYYIDKYAKLHDLSISKQKFNALYIDAIINGEKTLLIKPLSFMNLSGIVVKKFVDYYKLSLDDILVIHDDLDLSIGRIKVKKHTSSGGHNGVQNIIDNLGNNDFLHIKVGISNNKDIDTKDYVLGIFSKSDLEILDSKVSIINEIIDNFIQGDSSSMLMNKYNGVKDENI